MSSPASAPRLCRCSRTSAGCTKDRSIGLGHPGELRNAIGHGLETFLAFAQYLFRPLTFGDVARNFRSSDNRAIAVLDWRNRHRNVDPLAILLETDGFEMVNALTAPNSLQNVDFLFRAVRRHQHLHRFTERL